MKLSDIELTTEQAAAFMRWLNEEMAAQQRTDAAAAERAERAELTDVRFDKVCDLARKTAEMHGRLIGVRPHDQALAAWSAFVDSEGYFDRFDVDDLFEPGSIAFFEEGWVNAYVATIEGRG